MQATAVSTDCRQSKKRTIVHSISIIDAEHRIENVLDGCVESDFDLDIKMAAASEVSPSVQKNLDKLGFTMPEMIALSAMQADEYETCICESIEQQIEFELIQLLKSDIGMRKCKRCGKYFIMKATMTPITATVLLRVKPATAKT